MPDKTRGRGLRALIADELRRLADRLDRPGAPKAIHVSFTLEERVGMVFRDDGRGCRLWYLGDQDYERAHDQAGPLLGAHSEVWLPQRRHRDLVWYARYGALPTSPRPRIAARRGDPDA